MSLTLRRALTILSACALCACQSPTDPDEVPEIIEVTVAPDPAAAVGPTGRFYRVEGDDNEPDEMREFDWKATFTVTVRLTEDATDENVGLDLPLDITSATVQVRQASSGIVTPPTGGEQERYEFVIANASSNRFVAVNSSITMTFEVWYDLPNLRREALIDVTLGFSDDGSFQFTQVVPVRVSP